MLLLYHGMACILIGYLIGGINPSYIIGKMRGFDIRTIGSRNAGGSNAIITMGKKTGFLCCIFDVFKAYLAIRCTTALFPALKLSYALTSASCILGHMFPIALHFRGGKGLACLGGSILAYNPKIFAVMLLIEFVLLLIVNYLCIVPITASITYPIIYGVTASYAIGAAVFIPVTLAMIYKHTENIKRIKQGTELHFSYMWHKDEETQRIMENVNKIDSTQTDSLRFK